MDSNEIAAITQVRIRVKKVYNLMHDKNWEAKLSEVMDNLNIVVQLVGWLMGYIDNRKGKKEITTDDVINFIKEHGNEA